MSKANLRIDWATHAAAKYACENWHYSRCLPVGKTVKLGVWEDQHFIGVIIFGRGANRNMLKSFAIKQDQGAELVRIALNKHKTEVSRILKISLLFLKNQNAGLRLLVSYADPEMNHHGGIYQAGNWIYTGIGGKSVKIWYNQKWSHKKTVDDANVNQKKLKKKIVQGKHRYLMPLDAEMKEQILPLSKPYPKRAKLGDDCDQQNSDGATPIRTLQSNSNLNQ